MHIIGDKLFLQKRCFLGAKMNSSSYRVSPVAVVVEGSCSEGHGGKKGERDDNGGLHRDEAVDAIKAPINVIVSFYKR